MEESFISLQHSKENPNRRFSLFRVRKKRAAATKTDEMNRPQHLASTSAESDSNKKKEKKGRVTGWKSFFHVFTKSSDFNANSKPKSYESTPQTAQEPLQILNQTPSSSKCERNENSSFLNGNEDNLAMAITLPAHVRGNDVNVSIELKVIATGSKEYFGSSCGLFIKERSEELLIYSGNIKVPTLTTVLEVSKMPLYLISGDCPQSERKIETIIKPIDNILPAMYDPNLVVNEINLKLKFENINKPQLFKCDHLNYVFLSNGLIMQSLEDIKTEDLVDKITQEAVVPYKESSKILVKEILNQVVSKISLKSSVDIIEDFHKELEVQKSLLLETSSSILPKPESLLSKISESEQEEFPSASKITSSYPSITSESSLYAKSISTDHHNDSDSKYHLQVPANTPDLFMEDLCPHNNENAFESSRNYISSIPEYNYYSKRWPNNKSIRYEVKADIDRTLELLETAKNKLLCYLNQTSFTDMQMNNFRTARHGRLCELMPIERMLSSVEDVFEHTAKTIRVDPFQFRNQNQFFLGPPQETSEMLLCSTGNLTQNVDKHDDEIHLIHEFQSKEENVNKEVPLSEDDSFVFNKTLTEDETSESKSVPTLIRVEESCSFPNVILIKELLENEVIIVSENVADNSLCRGLVLGENQHLAQNSTCILDGFDSTDKIESMVVEIEEVANSEFENQVNICSTVPLEENHSSNDSNKLKIIVEEEIPAIVDNTVEEKNSNENVVDYENDDGNRKKDNESDDEFEVEVLHRYETRNDKIFRKRYSESGRDVKVSYSVIENDINIMIKELMDESNSIKEAIITKMGDAIKTESELELERQTLINEDVKFILDMVLNKVDEKLIMNHLQNDIGMDYKVQQVYQVNPVYFCFIDDLVDDSPANGCKDGQSTLSVRRFPSLQHPQPTDQYLSMCEEGLVDKLEKGASYMAELYKEIYTKPLSMLKFIKSGHPSNTEISMVNDLNKTPLIRKSNKIMKLEKNDKQPQERETIEEREEKVINPTKETLKLKPKESRIDNNSIINTMTETLGIVSWKTDWQDRFKKQFSETNKVVKRLSEVSMCHLELNQMQQNIKSPNKDSLHGRRNSTESNQKNKKQKNKDKGKPPSPLLSRSVKIKSVPNTQIRSEEELTFPSSEQVVHEVKPVNNSIQFNEDDKKSLDESQMNPGTSQNPENVVLFHESTKTAHFESTEGLVNFAHDSDATRIHQPVADVPRAYESSGAEIKYMQNIKVLQKKVDLDKYEAFSTSSSSVSSISQYNNAISLSMQKMPVSNSNISTITKLSDKSDINRLDYSTDASVISSRSNVSAPSTAYDADNENFVDILPRFRCEYVSKQELNEPDEIAKIEENVLTNKLLNPQETTSKDFAIGKNKPNQLIISSSEASTPTSHSLESEHSKMEINLL